MANWITKFLGFEEKPRDAAVAGSPLEDRDQLVMFCQTNQAVTLVSVNATVYNPENGKSRSFRAIGPFSSTLNNFTQETAQLSQLGIFSTGELLTAVSVVTSGTVPTGPNCFFAVFLLRQGVIGPQLIGDFLNVGHIPSWTGCGPNKIVGPFTLDGRPWSLFTFQGTVVNGAGGAGDQTLTIAPAAGSRVRMAIACIDNGDTSNRVSDIQVLDPTNRIGILMTGTINAANSCSWPNGSAQSATSNGAGIGPSEIAGSLTYQLRVIAVAASENSAFGVSLWVQGGAPTCTLAGASTPTLTTNTSRFETG